MKHRTCYLVAGPTENVRTAPRFYSAADVLAAFRMTVGSAYLFREMTEPSIHQVWLLDGSERIVRCFRESTPDTYSREALELGQRTVDALRRYAKAVRNAEQAETVDAHHLRAVDATRAACSVAQNMATLFIVELFEPGASRYQSVHRQSVLFDLWLCNLGDRISAGVGADAIERDADDLAYNMGLDVGRTS